MSAADAINTIVVVIGGFAAIYFGHRSNQISAQQNEIFREQNRIFAAQAGIPMPEQRSRPIKKRNWGLPAASFGVSLAVGMFLAIRISPYRGWWWAFAVSAPWTLTLSLASSVTYLWGKSKREHTEPNPQLSKLKIHSATYGALLPGSKQCDVTNCLRQMIRGDSLVLQIQNGNFWAGGMNYVEQDPREGEKKWLKVDYSFDGGEVIHTRRSEDYRLVLPEDTFIKENFEICEKEARYSKVSYDSDIRKADGLWRDCEKQKREALAEVDRLKREKFQQNSDLYKAQESRRQCEEERRAALDQIEQLKAKPSIGLLSPLQIEALSIAKDLRDFYAAYPFPDLPGPDFQLDQESLQRQISTRAAEQLKWSQKLLHAYANRGFGPRITALMHRLGEEIDYPVLIANFAENLSPVNKDTIPELAQQMEYIVLHINRKERGEVDLLHGDE